jgi:AcrR family transcriptional regulator
MPVAPSRRARPRDRAAAASQPQGRRATPQGPGAPRSEKRERWELDRRRAQLLELGIDLFSKRGYEDIAIDGVAEAAGISKGLLYHYFGSKREFYVETVRAASRRLLILTMPDPALEPLARLRAGIDAHLRYVRDHAAVYSAVFRNGVAIAAEVETIVEEHRKVVLGYFLEGLGVKKARPLLRTALRSWLAMVEGASLDWITEPSVPSEELRELLVAAYLALVAKAGGLDPKSVRATASAKAR